jgi:hypothetical protein
MMKAIIDRKYEFISCINATNKCKNSNTRIESGIQILESQSIHENTTISYTVPSQTSNRIYEVRLIQDTTTQVCTCADFEYRKIDSCKHIHALKLYIAANTYLKSDSKLNVTAEDAVTCKRCGSFRVVKNGFDYGKQTLLGL